MKRVRYTPGPWTISPHSNLDKEIIVVEPGVMVDNDDVDHAEAEGNALLVAAAPELLERLIEITDHLERIGDTRRHKDGQYIEDARAAILKATKLPRC